MKIFAALIIFTATTIVVSGCSRFDIKDYHNNQPKLNPVTFFNGSLSAHGVVKNRGGKVIRYFNADIKAHWQNNIGTLEEKFIFDDGEIQYRTWKLQPTSSTETQLNYTATAGDVIGTAQGKVAGNAFNLNYVLAVKYNKSTFNLSVDDWMWLVDDKTLLNESELTKFGFKVGSIQLVINKH